MGLKVQHPDCCSASAYVVCRVLREADAGATSRLGGEHLPQDAAAEHEENAGERGAVSDAGTLAERLREAQPGSAAARLPEVFGEEGVHGPLQPWARQEILLGGLRADGQPRPRKIYGQR